jgi:class 3 adenylate cyclase
MIPPETQYAVAEDGIHVAYQVTGGGDLDLVMLQGTVAHLEIAWEDPRLSRLFERLSAFRRLIRFDRRGMGMSEAMDRLPTFEEQVNDFATVMNAAGSDRAALMGTIDGGTLALAFAAANPDRVEAVVAFESPPRYTRLETDDFGVDPEALGRMADSIRSLDLETQLSIVAPSRINEPGFQGWFRRYNRAASSGVLIQAFTAQIMTIDITDRLQEITAPVLVVNRTEQPILPIRSARALAAALPNAELVEIPGDGTVIFSADVDLIADEVEEFLTGTRPPPRQERMLSTVLFTDVVGSTERASKLGDREWRELLGRHNQLLRRALARFGGREVNTAGDGFVATFDSPLRAIESARFAADSVKSIGLEIRAGVHTGEIEIAGEDIQGIAVHIGARIGAIAGASEVLVSSTVKDLVVGSGIDFADRGTHQLKGVPGEWRVFAAIG